MVFFLFCGASRWQSRGHSLALSILILLGTNMPESLSRLCQMRKSSPRPGPVQNPFSCESILGTTLLDVCLTVPPLKTTTEIVMSVFLALQEVGWSLQSLVFVVSCRIQHFRQHMKHVVVKETLSQDFETRISILSASWALVLCLQQRVLEEVDIHRNDTYAS
jgi:hypothetical protein